MATLAETLDRLIDEHDLSNIQVQRLVIVPGRAPIRAWFASVNWNDHKLSASAQGISPKDAITKAIEKANAERNGVPIVPETIEMDDLPEGLVA